MTGFWLISYVALWVIVIILSLLLVGVLQQIGVLQHQLGQSGAEQTSVFLPPPEQDGPDIGSSLPDLNVESVNGFGNIPVTENVGTLLLFMSPMCVGCQKIVDSINALVDRQVYRDRIVVILRADNHACQAFLKVFPLHVPVIQDQDAQFTKSFAIHHSPFGLLYDTAGVLLRKGVIERKEELHALIGETVERSSDSVATMVE
jgi:methylamine dehydrogenase accessory protein MauD